jgi:hypothetical protein
MVKGHLESAKNDFDKQATPFSSIELLLKLKNLRKKIK